MTGIYRMVIEGKLHPFIGNPSFSIFIRLILMILSTLSDPPSEDYPVILCHLVINCKPKQKAVLLFPS